jgi:hypothetical protein
MASKSTAQRVIEFIAIIGAIGCLVPVVIAVLGQFNTPTPPPKRTAASMPNPAAQSSSGTPSRSRVDSVETLPKTYPAIADVNAPRPPTTDEAAALRNNTRVRHLLANAGNGVSLSPDARSAVVFERTPANTTRLALWNLDTGKLIRFLGGEEGKATREYGGEENASFGSKVDHDLFQWGRFSPDGKKFAAWRFIGPLPAVRCICAWDVATGKLLWQVTEPAESALVLFPSADFLAIGSSVGMREYVWRRIDAVTGESELLSPVASGMGVTSEGAAHDGQIAYMSQSNLITIDVGTRLVRSAPADRESLARQVGRYFWYSADGQQLYRYGGRDEAWLDVWDVPAHKLVRSVKVAMEGSPQSDVYPAPAAGLVGNRKLSGGVDFFEVETGESKFSIEIPFRGAPLKAVSSDARRMLIQTDQKALLVVDFTADLPEGKVDLAALLGPGPLAATR